MGEGRGISCCAVLKKETTRLYDTSDSFLKSLSGGRGGGPVSPFCLLFPPAPHTISSSVRWKCPKQIWIFCGACLEYLTSFSYTMIFATKVRSSSGVSSVMSVNFLALAMKFLALAILLRSFSRRSSVAGWFRPAALSPWSMPQTASGTAHCSPVPGRCPHTSA